MFRGMVIGILGIVAALLLVGVVGCQPLTPEQQAKVDAAETALGEAAQQAETVKKTFDAYVAEYEGIKARVDAGESIPAAVVARYQQLASLLAQTKDQVVASVEKVKAAKATLEDAMASGVKWYHFLQPVLYVLLGIAGGYFPAAAPALAAARAIIQGVASVAATTPAIGTEVKKAVLQQSRDLGVETTVDKLVQKYDPPPA